MAGRLIVMVPMFPAWLHGLAMASLVLAVACAIAIALDELRHPQRMGVINLVWPLTALFGSLLWLAAYYRWGRASRVTKDDARPAFAASVLIGTSHCGAGCTLGDLIVEWTAADFPPLAIWFGYGWVFAERTFAIWIADFLLAFAIGVTFQYFAIQPMRHLGV